MTPAFWYKKSEWIASNKVIIFKIVIISLLVGSSVGLLSDYFNIQSKVLNLVTVVSGFTVFWCCSFFIVWLWFRTPPMKANSKNMLLKSGQVVGSSLEWFFAVFLSLWYTGLCLFTITVPFSLIFS
jgi:phage shock protein PspC (stress-responsive transcriptional regulator)